MMNTLSMIHRPGGYIITNRALGFCMFPTGVKILDLGCGSGATVDYLIQKYGFEAYGIDKNLELADVQNNLIKASAEKIPFAVASMDGVFMECSFSLMDDQDSVLKECNRVLKTNGRLIVSDLYARGEPAHLKGCLGHIDKKEDIISRIGNHGFKVALFEDFSHHLQTMWGQMLLEKGAASFYANLGAPPEMMKHIKCGYFLIVAKKEGQSI